MRQSDDCSSQVGLIGAGRWGGNLVRVLHSLGVLGMVADTDPGARADLRARYPELKLGEDPQAVIGNDALRAVVVATPAPTHYEIAKRALLAGKDVFVEKPLALSSADAHELTSLAETKRAVLMAGHLLLYQPAIQWVKEYLASGALGELYTLHQERLKLGRVRSVENVLWSFGVHDLAVMLYLLGEAPGQVRATGQRVLQGGIEDNVHLDLWFSRGARAHLHVSWLWPEQRRRLTIVGAKGMLVYDELEATVTLHRKTVGADLRERDEGSEVLFRATGDALEAECLHFLSCVRTRRSPLSDGRSAVEVLRVIEAAQAAMSQEGVPARRPLVHASAYVDEGAEVGPGTKVWHFSHVMAGARIGRDCTLGQNVFVASGAVIGDNVRIQNNCSVYEGVVLEDDTFCGPSVVFTNVKRPRTPYPRDRATGFDRTLVKRGATLGANSTIVCGVTIGDWAFVAAGALVTRDVPPYSLVLGVPDNKVAGWVCECGAALAVAGGGATCPQCGRRYQASKAGLSPRNDHHVTKPRPGKDE